MNDNRIISFSGFDSSKIDREDYANSLAAEAYRVGFFSDSDIEKLKNDLLSALAEVIGYYTKNESTSLKINTAQMLSKSMMFNIDTYLLSLCDDKSAAEILRDRKPIELYGKGYLINQKLYKEAAVLFLKARNNRLKSASEEYNKTLDRYFKNYLTDYDPKFSAHNKIFLSLSEYEIDGAFHISGAVDALKKLIEINAGVRADYEINVNPSAE
ncbi:MAG: hypothetical protein E7672_05485 [Ruminococcaceae bacterium]|nr:hypothetical protein [Oscillospiraceae bacterium]